MRPRNPWAVGLFLLGVIWFADSSSAAARPLTVDDVLRLHSAGVSEEIILSEIIVTETVFELDVAEILRLHEAGVSERVVQFMIDTARDPDAAVDEATEDLEDSEELEEASDEDVDEDGSYSDSRLYVNLRYGYPAWWYDVYWWDYWYYDCHYDPWYVSWTHPCGAWYPTWYYPSSCWVSPGWGYRCDWWGSSYRVRWDDHSWYRNCETSLQVVSPWKYKSRGGTSGAGVLASGLKTREGSRLDAVKPVRQTALASDDVRRVKPNVRRPALTVRNGKDPVRGGKDPDVRRPVRPVRKPAVVDHPVRKTVRTPVRAPDVERGKSPRGSDRPVRLEDRSKPSREGGKKPALKPAPDDPKPSRPDHVESPRSAPETRSSPPPRSSRGGDGGGKSTRSEPRGGGGGKRR